MINDQILSEGGSIKGFKVVKIGDTAVTLQSEDIEIVLKLPQ
jgi:hypothetical protein